MDDIMSLHAEILKLTNSTDREDKFMLAFQRLMLNWMKLCDNEPIISLYKMSEESPNTAKQLFTLTSNGKVSKSIRNDEIHLCQDCSDYLCQTNITTDRSKLNKDFIDKLLIVENSNIRIYAINSSTKCYGFLIFEATGDELTKFASVLDLIVSVVNNFLKADEIKTALRKSEFKYKEIVEMLPEIVFETDIGGNITFMNQDGRKAFGLNEDEELDINLKDLFSDTNKNTIELILQMCIKSKASTFTQDLYGLSKSGEIFPVLLRMNAVKNGKVSGTRGIMINITEQKKAIEKIEMEKSKFEGLINLIPQPVVACDCKYNIIYVNKPFVDLIDKKDYDECIGTNISNIFTNKVDFNTFKNLLREDKSLKGAEFLLTSFRGREFIGSISASRHVEGKDTAMICLINDITKKREVEAFSQLNNTIDRLVESNKVLADSLTKISTKSNG